MADPNPSADANIGHPWKPVAIRVTWVAGIYCALMVGLLLFDYARSQKYNPTNHPELLALKEKLVKKPNDTALAAKIRSLDLELRVHNLQYLRRLSQGSWMLFFGAMVLMPALHFATWRKKLPRPGKYVLQPDLAEADDNKARWAVAGVFALAAGAALYLGSRFENPLDVVLARSASPQASPQQAPPSPAVIPANPPSAGEIVRNWPRFRGPGGSGVSAYTNLTLNWNIQTGENVIWKTEVPLTGPSSPIVWNDRVFLIGASAVKREVYCFDVPSGKLLWQKTVGTPSTAPPKDEGEEKQHSPSTPATDGRRVYAMFDTGELAAFDFNGNQLWYRQWGKLDNPYGHAASLDFYKNILLVQLDQGDGEDGKSKIYGVDAATGKDVWVTEPRPVPASWATPIIIQAAGKDQLIASGNPWMISYNPADGKEIWRAKILNGEITPSPVFAAGLIFNANDRLWAVKPDGQGDVTKTHVAWSGEDGIPDICSPVSDGKRVWLLTSSGTITCYSAGTGKKLYEKDLELECKASPSVVGDTLMVVSEKGTVVFVKSGDQYQEIGRAEIGEHVMASPAFADGRIFIRGKKHLFCFGRNKG